MNLDLYKLKSFGEAGPQYMRPGVAFQKYYYTTCDTHKRVTEFCVCARVYFVLAQGIIYLMLKLTLHTT